MVTEILVPLDGSPLAEQALPCAMALSRGLADELVLFGAVSIPPDTQEILGKAGVKADALLQHSNRRPKSIFATWSSNCEKLV